MNTHSAPPLSPQRYQTGSRARVSSRFRNSPSRPLRLVSLLAATLVAAAPHLASASSCTTQAALPPAQRDALTSAGNVILQQVASTTPSSEGLRASLLPAVLPDWEAIRSVAAGAVPLLKGGQPAWRSAYLLDASDLKAPQDTQFFCTNAEATLTVSINLRGLPPGRYAFLIADYPGATYTGQLALILGAESTSSPSAPQWKLGGLFAREGSLDSHDGIWFWSRARDLSSRKLPWSAWYAYDMARYLLVPVDFLSTPNLEKLNREQAAIAPPPGEAFPLSVTAPASPGKSFRITALRIDATLHAADLALTYEGSGITDPVAARAEAVAVMSALLHTHPDLRETFHGLWAFAERDGKQSYAIELAMRDIP